jgi:Ca2+-binding RTX toxin-like protein
VTLVGVVVDQVASTLLGSIGVTLVPDHIDYSSYSAAAVIKGTNSLIGGDIIISTDYNDTISAYGGNDHITNQGGSDRIFGGSGTDTIDYSSHADGILVYIDGLIDGVGNKRPIPFSMRREPISSVPLKLSAERM